MLKFLHHEDKQNRRHYIMETNEKLRKALDDYWRAFYPLARQELLNDGFSYEKADAILQKTKNDVQLDIIKSFKKNLKAEVSARKSSSKEFKIPIK